MPWAYPIMRACSFLIGLIGLIGKMVDRLEAVREGDSMMMDNTLVVYLSDAPGTHDWTSMDSPLLLVGDISGRLKLGGRYINSPGHGKLGHRTVGSFYTTMLNVAGVKQGMFGQLDSELDQGAMQTGPCPELFASISCRIAGGIRSLKYRAEVAK